MCACDPGGAHSYLYLVVVKGEPWYLSDATRDSINLYSAHAALAVLRRVSLVSSHIALPLCPPSLPPSLPSRRGKKKAGEKRSRRTPHPRAMRKACRGAQAGRADAIGAQLVQYVRCLINGAPFPSVREGADPRCPCVRVWRVVALRVCALAQAASCEW